MVQRRVFLPFLVVLFVSTGLAGCLSEDDPTAATGPEITTAAGTEGSDPSATSSLPPTGRTTVDADEAVFAPTLSVGHGWTYDVSGSKLVEPHTVTLGVVSESADHYAIGADNDAELQFGLLHDGGLFLGGMQKETLAVQQGDKWQDLVGFDKAVGDKWDVLIYGTTFTLEKMAVESVTTPAGEGQGVRLEGMGGDDSLTVVYSAKVKGLAELVWKDKNGNDVLAYRLTGVTDAAQGLKQWHDMATARAVAALTLSAAGATQFNSNGTGDLLFLYVAASDSTAGEGAVGRPAVGTIMDPDNQATEFVFDGMADTVEIATFDDKQGTWWMAGLTAGPRVDMQLYQIRVLTF